MKQLTLAGVALLGILVGTQIAVAGPTECKGTLSGVLIAGDLDVPAGDKCELSGVIVTGNVTVEGTFVAVMGVMGGNLQGNQTSGITLTGVTVVHDVNVQGSFAAVTGTIIGGNLQGNQASSIILTGSTVIGNLQANQTKGHISPGNIVCASTIGGNVQIQQSGPNAPWLIEAVPALRATACASPNSIRGDLQFQNNAAPGVIDGNTVGGNLQFQNNDNTTGTSGDISGNTVGNSLQCQNNSQPPTGTAGSNIVIQQKTGQCATF